MKTKTIYESPDGGETIYKRRRGDLIFLNNKSLIFENSVGFGRIVRWFTKCFKILWTVNYQNPHLSVYYF